MTLDQRPKPLGFGRCVNCAYLKTGTPEICFGCARRSIEALPLQRCSVCDLPLHADGMACSNPICNWGDRFFEWNHAAAMRSGVLEDVIHRYKYQDKKGWAHIFARVLVGLLEEERDLFRPFDLIVASPSWVGEDGRAWDHTRAVVLEANELDMWVGGWPFDVDEPAAIVKIAPTERMMGKSWPQRRAIATGALRAALRIPDRTKTAGKQILVYDDVFTGGQTLNEVGRCLTIEGGASRVCGVSLTRQPYGGQPR
jgi:predicted amidophosphoribosyltransferase